MNLRKGPSWKKLIENHFKVPNSPDLPNVELIVSGCNITLDNGASVFA